MASGHLCLCFDCDFNRITTEENALFFSSSDELVDLLRDVDSGMGISRLSYKLATNRYTWDIIAGKYEALFNKFK